MHFEWNRAKSILDAEEGARIHRLKIQVLELKKTNTNGIKKLCIILHTIMRENGDPGFEKLQCYLTINKLYGHAKHISMF